MAFTFLHSFSSLAPWSTFGVQHFMSDSHRLVSTSGGGSFHESPFMAVIARIPAGTNFAASGIGSISFQGNFIADRLCLATSRTFQANISSRPCFLGISSSQSFKTKPSEVNRKSFQICKLNCLCLLYLQSSGWLPHLLAGCLEVKSGEGLSSQSDWTQS